jgi:AcrR family transcriptional regulator
VPRPKSLTEDQIAAAALAVLDREGLSGLSMRAVAKELGVGTMSLYRYVDSRDELERLVVDLVLDAAAVERPVELPWQEQIEVLVGRVRAAVGRHTAVGPLLLVHRESSLATQRWGETVMAALATGGIVGTERVVAFRTLLGWLLGTIQVEHLGPLAGAGTRALAALSPEDYPNLTDVARHALELDPDEAVRRGLQILLRGLGG